MSLASRGLGTRLVEGHLLHQSSDLVLVRSIIPVYVLTRNAETMAEKKHRRVTNDHT